MNPSAAVREIEIRTGIKQLHLMLLCGSMLLNILLGIGVVMADRTHRETVIPPEISKTFWVEDRKASDSYLEQMGLFIIRLALDVSPASGEYQMRQILRYTLPSSYGLLEKHLLEQTKRMSRDKVSTSFAVTAVSVNQAMQSVKFNGTLRTMLVDKTVAETSKTYEVRFAFGGGRIYLKELVELNAKGEDILEESVRTQ